MGNTAMMDLIKWIDSEILLNPYYNTSPRLCEGAMIVKVKATELLKKENQEINILSRNQILNLIEYARWASAAGYGITNILENFLDNNPKKQFKLSL